VVQYLTGAAPKLLSEFAALRSATGASTCWARGYWAASIIGNVTDEVWKEYIKNLTPPEPDDAFKVV
jgi:hypothetical protein